MVIELVEIMHLVQKQCYKLRNESWK